MVNNQINQLYNFISQFKFLYDFYAVNFITKNFFSSFPWKVGNYKELLEIFNGKINDNYPQSLVDFIRNSKGGIDRIYKNEITEMNNDLMIGMNSKKVQETSQISRLIQQISIKNNVNYILDIGGGQGYLSSVLALQYGYHVIAIDSNVNQVDGGESRYKRILNLYKLHGREIKGSLRFITKYINEGLDELMIHIEKLYSDSIDQKWLIVGLHTCGDLAVSMIKGFCNSKNENIKGLVNLGCCYQLLTDFPLSRNKIQLDRNALMLACQPFQRLSNEKIISESVRRLYYRAVFEKILVDHSISNTKPIKKMGVSGYKDPISYTRESLYRIQCDLVITDNDILKIFDDHEYVYNQIFIVWILRSLLAESIESLILLDRLEFAQEMGFNAELIPAVDQFISPRNMALIIQKT
jgi:hypothetical protein